MSEHDLEKLAAKNAPMPEGLDAAEQILYQSLTLLHRRYRQGMMDSAAAKRERYEIIKQYEINRSNVTIWQRSMNRWKELEGPVHDYLQEPTIGKANRIIDMVYGCKHIWKEE